LHRLIATDCEEAKQLPLFSTLFRQLVFGMQSNALGSALKVKMSTMGLHFAANALVTPAARTGTDSTSR
jgi:hypothetical protein